jgi:hypothetical protein
MAPRTRKRILLLFVVTALIVALREASIRRHEPDLHDWPRPA